MSILIRIIAFVALLFAITIHEAAHGWSAFKLGDPTAYHMGRVTLNPIPHIDPIGTILFPLIMMITGIPFIGWAKPVPVNPLNLRNYRRDNLLISAAGPLSNLTAAGICMTVLLMLKAANPRIIYEMRFFLAGQSPFTSGKFAPIVGIAVILYFGLLINTVLAVFNMIPIPPLDGSGVLMGFLSEEVNEKYEQIRPYGFLIILALLFLGFFNLILNPIQRFFSIILLS